MNDSIVNPEFPQSVLDHISAFFAEREAGVRPEPDNADPFNLPAAVMENLRKFLIILCKGTGRPEPTRQALYEGITNDITGAAVMFARCGFSVFPCGCGKDRKNPYTNRGFKDASNDENVVRAMFSAEYPDRTPHRPTKIGLVTGDITGVFGIDADGPVGWKSLQTLMQKFGILPDTLIEMSTRDDGGLHFLYLCPVGKKVPSTIEFLDYPKIDTRGNGGYLIVSPSVHLGQMYKPVHFHSLSALPEKWVYAITHEKELKREVQQKAAQLSTNLNIDLSKVSAPRNHSDPEFSGIAYLYITPPNAPDNVNDSARRKWVLTAVSEELENVRRANKGVRNSTLATSAFRLGQLSAAGLLDGAATQDALARAAEHLSQDDGENATWATIKSGWKLGENKPRAFIPDFRRYPSTTVKKPTVAPVVVDETEPPLPLRREVQSQTPFPVDVLLDINGDSEKGDDLASLVRDLATAYNCSTAMVASVLLSILSMLVQGWANIRTPKHKATPLSLFMLIICPSGQGKSSIKAALMPVIDEEEQRQKQAYAKAKKDFKAKKRIWEVKLRSLEKELLNNPDSQEIKDKLREHIEEEPEPPVTPYLTLTDVNQEGLFRALDTSRPSIGLMTDEAVKLFGNCGFLPENADKFFGSLSDLWSGGTLDKCRHGEETIKLMNRRICSCLQMQPYLWDKLVKNPVFMGQGYGCRNLICWQEATRQTVEGVDVSTLPAVQNFYQLCRNLLLIPITTDADTGGLLFRELTLTDRAFQLYAEFAEFIEDLRIPADGLFNPISSYAVRMAEQALRIAGVLTLTIDPGATVIEFSEMGAGVTIAEWYVTEFLRVQNAAAVSAEIQNAETLLDWFRTRNINATCIRQIQQFGPSGLREKRDIEAVFATLNAHGWMFPMSEAVDVWMGDGATSKTKHGWKVRI